MPARDEVYDALNSERNYQLRRWPDERHHSPTEWLVFIEDYLNEAKHIASRVATPEADKRVMDIMRKIGGMAVAAMEQNGAPKRES